MLQDPTEWDFEAPIPGPPPPAGDHFWVLSEGIPRLFRVERDRRRSIVTDIAHALQYTTDHVTVQPTRPRIIDHLGFGCPTWAVVVATETLQTIPYPPARRPESRKILVLDCRAILAGFRWQLVAGGQITVQEIADQFHEVCPPNFLVVLKGADIFHTPDGQAIQVTNGLIVKIEFVEEAPLESAESEAVEPLTSDEDMGPETSGNGGPPTNDEAPGPDTASCEGSVAAAGLSPRSRSPRDRYTNDTNDQNPIMEGAEGVDFRAFGILAPGFCEEIVQVKLEESPLLHHATRAVQAAREANYAQAFPLLQPVSHQPNRHKGYYLATPLWPYQGVIVCIDMLTAWHRIFAVVTSPVADKTALLLCAGLSPAADVDVYANGLGPIEQQLSLRDGDCVTVLWRGMPAPPTLSMQALLEDSESRSAAESDLSSEDDSHYCLVGADGCQLFSLRHQRSAFYRADIALRVGCDPNELQLTPSVPRCDDASMFGFNCCAVVAALRVGHIPLDAHICVSCIDARRLLRAWMPIATSDGWVYLPEVVQTLGTSVPTDWCVYLEGVDEEQTWWYCEPGSILVAACGPAEDRPSVPVSGGTQDAQVDEPACSASTTDTPQAKATQATTMDSVPDACSQRITRTPSMTNCIRRFFRVRSLKSQLTTSCQKDTEEQPLREHDLQTDYAKIGSARGRWGSRLPLMLVVLCHSTTCGGSMHLQGVSRGALRGTAVGLTDVMQVDMWPDGFHDDARARGPHQSTPILPVHRVASTQPVSNLHSACHTLGNGPPAPAKVSTGCGVGTLPCDQYTRRGTIGTIPVATPCRALTKRCNATNKQLVIHPIEEKTVLEELFACEGEQFCFDTWTLLETLTEHFEPLIRKEPELTRRRRGIFSDASSEAFLPPEGKRLSLQDMVPVSLVQQLEGRPHPFAHAPPAALLEDKLRLGGMVMPFEGGDLLRLLRAEVELNPWESFPTAGGLASRNLGKAISQESLGLNEAKIVCYTDGSFYPPSVRTPARAGWAVIFVVPHLHKTAWTAGAVPAYEPTGSGQLSAYTAECFALAIVHLYTALRFAHCAVIYKSDCQAAVGIVQGTMSHKTDPYAQVLANAVAFRAAIAPSRDRAEYVPGHAGTFFNESADSMAKKGAVAGHVQGGLTDSVFPFWLHRGGTRLAWAGVMLQRLLGNQAYPSLEGNAGQDTWHAGLSGQQLIAPFIPDGCVRDEPGKDELRSRKTLDLVVSYNTLSLGASLEEADGSGTHDGGLQYRPGRAAILAEQLHAKGANIAALQETRGQEGRTRIGKFLRYSSGSIHGQYGTELWLHTEKPLMHGRSPTESIFFNDAQVVVVHRDPRRMIIRFQVKAWRLLIASLHAPHRGSEAHMISSWWKDTKQLLHKFANAAFVIIAGDVNASVGSFISSSVGPTAAEQEDLPGQNWHSILRSLDCWLPCTFEEYQDGETHTYFQKRNGQGCRPDMIGMPMTWHPGKIRAWVAPDIHVALAVQDHFATCVSLSIQLALPEQGKKPVRARLSPEALQDPRNAEAIDAALASLPQVPWEVSSHAHSAIVVGHLQQHLGAIVVDTGPRPRQPYITEETWQVQREVTWWRRSLQRLQQHVRTQWRAALFDIWKSAVGGVHAVHPSQCSWFLRASLRELAHRYHISRESRKLRYQCRRDRDAYISALADKVAHNPSNEVFSALHKLLCHRRKRPYAPEPLPYVLNEHNEPCADAQEMQARWRQHFGQMEGGKDSDFGSLPEALLHAESHSAVWPAPPNTDMVPSLADFTQVMLATKAGKAPGPDGIPGILLKKCASRLAPALYPILLKLVLRGSESLGFKGGVAVKFWKGKGSKSDVAAYRQILLVSSLAKCIHQALRPALRDLFVQQAPSLQLGGRPGSSVVYGAHVTRSFLRWQASCHSSCFILFTDIASAYYSVVRQLVAKSDSGRAAEDWLRGMDLPLEDLELLARHSENASALQEAGATGWLESLAQRLTDSTWFVLQNDKVPVITTRGTRPGSSWADLLFSFVVRRILQRRDALQDNAGGVVHAPVIPDDTARTLQPCDNSKPLKALEDLIWADDIATMKVADSAVALPRGIKTSVGTSCDSFAEHGFRLSFGRCKTAVLAQPAGDGAKSTRRLLFGAQGMQGEILAMREHAAPAKVPLVSEYRHLGAQVAVKGGMRQEVAFRAAQAHAAFGESRRKVFKAPGIPLRRKSFILRAMVLPKLTYGCGAWPPLGEGEYRVFAGALWSMYRQVLCIPHHADQHVSAATILALLEMPGPAVILHTQRMLYLGQLTRTGPSELWTLIRLDRSYSESVASSTRWLFRWVHQTCPLPDPDRHWEAWIEIMTSQRNRFKGWVLRAQMLEIRRCQVVAALEGLYKVLRGVAGMPTEPREPAQVWTEVCIPCKKVFSSRVAWSCHAQRVHGYRTQAYLVSKQATRPLCEGCGKLYASIGRLRCHLRNSTKCLATWGAFRPEAGPQVELHPQAPPEQIAGCSRSHLGLGLITDISQPLLDTLRGLCRPSEESVWEIIVEHVEPLDIIRNTVKVWQRTLDSEEDRETANNMLLLLDVDLLGEIRVTKPAQQPCPADVAPDWTPLPPCSFHANGTGPPLSLQAPPEVILSPFGPTSVTLRAATAYATWLEQACACIARCFIDQREAPSGVVCKGLARSLGPAADWLGAIGSVIDDYGLALQP